jgi:hypothetical protein
MRKGPNQEGVGGTKRRIAADIARLHRRIVTVTKHSPEMAPTEIGLQIGCSHVTVRKVQRAAGIYKKRGASGQLQEEES